MAISFIAGAAGFDNSASATVATSASLNIATGDTIVTSVRIPDNAQQVNSVTDSAGNEYVRSGYALIAGLSRATEIWICKNAIAHATNIITATYSSGILSNRAIIAAHFRALGVISPLDVFVKKAVATTGITSDAFTTTVANAILIAIGHVNSLTGVWTVGAGYTEAIRNVNNLMLMQYKIVSAIQTGVTASMSSTDAAGKNLIVISLHEDIVGGGGGSSEHSYAA